jgi:hypothetical protein
MFYYAPEDIGCDSILRVDADELLFDLLHLKGSVAIAPDQGQSAKYFEIDTGGRSGFILVTLDNEQRLVSLHSQYLRNDYFMSWVFKPTDELKSVDIDQLLKAIIEDKGVSHDRLPWQLELERTIAENIGNDPILRRQRRIGP